MCFCIVCLLRLHTCYYMPINHVECRTENERCYDPKWLIWIAMKLKYKRYPGYKGNDFLKTYLKRTDRELCKCNAVTAFYNNGLRLQSAWGRIRLKTDPLTLNKVLVFIRTFRISTYFPGPDPFQITVYICMLKCVSMRRFWYNSDRLARRLLDYMTGIVDSSTHQSRHGLC